MAFNKYSMKQTRLREKRERFAANKRRKIEEKKEIYAWEYRHVMLSCLFSTFLFFSFPTENVSMLPFSVSDEKSSAIARYWLSHTRALRNISTYRHHKMTRNYKMWARALSLTFISLFYSLALAKSEAKLVLVQSHFSSVLYTLLFSRMPVISSSITRERTREKGRKRERVFLLFIHARAMQTRRRTFSAAVSQA